MGSKKKLSRAATVATVAVVMLTVLLVTPVAAQDNGADNTVEVTATSGPNYEVQDFYITKGKGTRVIEAGDDVSLVAKIKNTGDMASGDRQVEMSMERPEDWFGGGRGSYYFFNYTRLASGQEDTLRHTWETDDDQGGDWVFTVNTGDESVSKTITLCCEPEASIDSHTPEIPNVGEAVTFTGSGDDPDYDAGKGSRGPDLTYEWRMINEDTGRIYLPNGRVVNQSFERGGKKTIELTVVDDDSQEKTVSTTVTVNRPPSADFSWKPTNPNPGEEIQFDASQSSDSDGTIENYEWDLDGDGAFEKSGRKISTTYSGVSAQDVTLRVTDDDGSSVVEGSFAPSTITKQVRVNTPPTASFDFSPSFPEPGESTEFDGKLSYDPDGSIQSYEWDFDGDGVFEESGETVNKAFANIGDKEVTLRVTDDQGLSTSKSINVPVTEPPTASIGHSPSPLITGEAGTFTADASDPDGTVESYEWDFDGDGTTDATGESVNNAFGTNGEKSVKLTVTDDTGASTTVSKTVTVTERPTVGIDYSPSPPVVRSLESLKPSTTFTPSSDTSDPDGTIESYWWVIDGEVVSPTPALGYKFQNPGEYDVELVVEDDDGASASASVTVTATYAPDVSIESSPTPLITGEAGEFTANATDRDGTVESYEWDFDGDDSTDATGKKVNKKFGTSGEKKIALTITDDTGASTTVTKTVTVSSIEYTPSQPNVGESVSMSLSSSAYDLDSIESYEWRIDGEVAASGPSPSLGLYNGFETRGDHEVSLNITYDDGTSVTESVTIPVNGPPEAAFDVTGDASGPGFEVSLDAGASSDIEGDTLNYEIDWGDGSTDTGVRAEHTYGTASEKIIVLTVTDEHGLSDTAEKTVGAGGKRSTGRGNSGNVGDNKRNRGRNGRGYERSRRNRGR